MLRCACAALAVTAALLAWPAYAQDEEAGEETTVEETTETTTETTIETTEETDAEPADEEPAYGEDEDDGEVDFNRTGPYLSLAGAWAVEKFDHADDFDIEDAVGVNARAGWRVLSWLSAELVGEYLPKFDVDFGPDSGDLMLWNIGGNLRLNLPTDLIQPYVIAGGGYLGAELDGASAPSGWDGHGGFGRIGGGIEFYPWEHVGLDAGVAFVIPAGDDVEDLDYLSITWGLLYRF